MPATTRARDTPPAGVLWVVGFFDLVRRYAAHVAVLARSGWGDRARAVAVTRRFVALGARPAREAAARAATRGWRTLRSPDARWFAGRVALAAVVVAGGFAVVVNLGRTAVVALGEGAVGHVADVQLPALEDRSVVLAADGSPITVLDGGLNRKVVPLDAIAPVLVDAVVASEDEQFWEHEGVDARAVIRAAGRNAQAGEVRQGGSTITQQLVKNTLLTSEQNVERKLTEVVLARAVERRYSKQEILERYLNTVYFGHGAYGVQAAAETYFGKPAAEVDVAEAALLAGLIQSPNGYDPLADPAAATARRGHVLDRMIDTGALDASAADAARTRPLPASVHPMQTRTSFVTDAVTKELLADERLGPTVDDRRWALLHGGLQVRTTIDPRLQALAEQAIAGGVPKGHDLNAALVSVDPTNGAVRAMVGGTDYAAAQFDAATEGARQPGSSFKTFTLVAALEAKHHVGSTVSGSAPCPIPNPGGKPNPWEPENYEGAAYGPVTITDATTSSVNCAYARIASAVGFDKVAETAKRLGVASKLGAVPSLTLGTEVVTPLDMAAAYATLAADGVAHAPVLVSEVRRNDGSVVVRNESPARPAVDREVARMAAAVLKEVVDRGTGTPAAVPGHTVGGKTGTAQNYQDAWFVGFSRHLSTAVWMGNLHGEVPMRNVGGIDVTGGSYPARIWSSFMRGALAPLPPAPFPAPNHAWFSPVGSLDGSAPATPPPAPPPDSSSDRDGDGDGGGDGKPGKRDD